jgi:LysR family transcriptional regulator, low CO2-responsive transcriptional regulator
MFGDTIGMIDGDLLASFLAFGDCRNLTRAARAVGVSQPALFERLRRLAELVGEPLYVRHGRELVLTEAGTSVLAFAREERARHERLLAELRGSAAVTRREVVLAAGEGAYLYLLGPALDEVARRDDVVVQPLTLGARDTIAALRAGRAHLGVAVVDLVPRGIVAEPLLVTPLCLCMPARHRAARARTLALADLRGERWVLPPEGQLHRDLVSRAIARTGDAPAGVIEADGWPLMLAFVARGLGVAVVNGTCVPPPGAVLRPLPELGTVTYQLLARRGAELPPEADELAAVIRRTASRSTARGPGARRASARA